MSAPPWITESADGVTLSLVVQPRAGRTSVVGEHGGALKIRLAAPPVDGEANAELIAFLSKTLGVRRGDVEIRSGESSRRKLVTVRGITGKDVLERLGGP